MKKILQAGDWEVYQFADGTHQASQLDERHVFSVHRTFADESEVQSFIRERQLALIGTGTHGTWPMRQYRVKL